MRAWCSDDKCEASWGCGHTFRSYGGGPCSYVDPRCDNSCDAKRMISCSVWLATVSEVVVSSARRQNGFDARVCRCSDGTMHTQVIDCIR